MRNQKGVTLVALVVTIIVLIILAGISINLLLGDNGLITKAKEAKKQQKIAEIKEKISLELSAAETDAIIRNENLEEEQLNDIVSKYGTLQEDKDTILTKDDNYKISLKEIWYGTLSTSGSYSDKKKQIEMLEKELKELQDKYNELEQINSGNSEVLNDLRNQITRLENEKKALEDSLKAEQDKNKTLETQMADLNSKYDNLKKEYDKFFNDPGTATADNISEGKTAWVNGDLITGTAKNSNVYYLGTGTSFNVSSISGFENFDSSNFIVGGISAPDMKTSRYTTGAGNVEDRAAARGFTINKTYDKTTGILSLSGTSQTIQIHKNSNGYSSWASDQQNINCFAYLVLGNIQNIP